MHQEVFIIAIIRRGEEVLFCHSADQPQLLTLPGGHLPPATNPESFLRTKFSQELGGQPSALQLFSTNTEMVGQTQIVHIVFLVSFDSLDTLPVDKLYSWRKPADLTVNDVDMATGSILNISRKPALSNQPSAKEENNVVMETIKPQKELLIYTDGGARGNPGPSAAAYVIFDPQENLLFKRGAYLGITTNNQAEYQAVKLALEKAVEFNASVVKFRMDSLLIVNQMLGIYQIKNRDLWPIYTNIKELIQKFDQVTFQHVRREFNKEADALVNKTLDEHR